MCWSTVFGEIPSRCPICFVISPPATSASTSASRSVRPAGRGGESLPASCPAGLEHRRDRRRVQPPCAHLVAEQLRGPCACVRGTVGSRLDHRLVGVCGGKDPVAG